MILTEEEAKSKKCIPLSNFSRPMPPNVVERFVINCRGSECVAYWKWADLEHTKGYCSISGKPEYE